MSELTTHLCSSGLYGRRQVIAVVDMIGEAFCISLKDMLKIHFLPSGMPTGEATPVKPRKAICAYIREAEHPESPVDHHEGVEDIHSGTARPPMRKRASHSQSADPGRGGR